jgi:hypothetical protein
MIKPKQGHIWRRWNTTLTAENASNRPPRLTGEVPNCGVREQIPYGSLDDDGTTLLQSDERVAEGMDH